MARFRDDPIGVFYQELEECTRHSKFYDPPRPFVLASRLLDWLRERPEVDESSARATIILETVYGGREPWAGAWNHFDERMAKGHNQCWLKLLVILLQMDSDGSFAKHLDAFYQAEMWDSRLSDLHRRSQELFGIIMRTGFYGGDDCDQAVSWFLHLATQLSTQRAMTMQHKRHLEPHILLPITEKDGINSGGQSNVFRIEVPHECISSDLVNHLKRLQRQAIPDPDYDGKSLYYEFALKKIDKEEDWVREIEFHRALRASQTEGIVQCLGSWEVQTGTKTEYYLLMEFGWSDLNQYFRSIPPPSIAQHIYDFWRSLSSVIPALSHIHNLAISSNHSSTVVRYYV
ncbi:hypothetical protein CONLIGDRAFT_250699 [Coniochaeta ligniaria NRRL 30616]|uniref:Protein kinase domain-containing protein n=1 Tax=Coniochaeta ligniaria NRRL 30616 TaxID=1408157 RepID=A0A1J7IX22_9PEZI|nr:hypothetical protein CONLIGDRAFT_250699 [Coniochaeta ligniaria NRRL 30616]